MRHLDPRRLYDAILYNRYGESMKLQQPSCVQASLSNDSMIAEEMKKALFIYIYGITGVPLTPNIEFLLL